jgi:hypothetical protein
MKLPKEFKEKWITALRSGEYKQGNLQFYNRSNNSYCCLGVAAEVAGYDLKASSMVGEAIFHKGMVEIDNIIEIFIENENIQWDLVRMNDGKKYTFLEIADWIESNL